MARACGSYPQCPRFESRCRYQIKAQPFDCAFLWPVGQVVKTPPFHGGNMGSSPVRVTRTKEAPPHGGASFVLNISRRDEKGAGVNDVPVARQSRDLARPQAGSPVRVTKNRQASEGACRLLLLHSSLCQSKAFATAPGDLFTQSCCIFASHPAIML